MARAFSDYEIIPREKASRAPNFMIFLKAGLFSGFSKSYCPHQFRHILPEASKSASRTVESREDNFSKHPLHSAPIHEQMDDTWKIFV